MFVLLFFHGSAALKNVFASQVNYPKRPKKLNAAFIQNIIFVTAFKNSAIHFWFYILNEFAFCCLMLPFIVVVVAITGKGQTLDTKSISKQNVTLKRMLNEKTFFFLIRFDLVCPALSTCCLYLCVCICLWEDVSDETLWTSDETHTHKIADRCVQNAIPAENCYHFAITAHRSQSRPQ